MGMRINLDQLVEDLPVVEWQGKDYRAADLQPQELVGVVKVTEQARQAEEDDSQEDMLAMFEELQAVAKKLVPSLPDECLEAFGFVHTRALIQNIVDYYMTLDPTKYASGLDPEARQEARGNAEELVENLQQG